MTSTIPAQTGSHEYIHTPETYSEKLIKRKKKIRMNLIEFTIGIVLLVFCFNYLKSHPAEKLSVFSSVEVIMQKVKVAMSQWTSGQGSDLKEKYTMERSYREMLHIIEDGNCLDPLQREEIKRMYSRLQEIHVSEFVQQKDLFTNFLSITYSKVQENCETDLEVN